MWQQFLAESGASAFAVLAVVALGHVTLRWWVLRAVRQRQHREAARSGTQLLWLREGIREVLPPCGALIWTQGLYVAFAFVLGDIDSDASPGEGRVALDWAYRLAVVAAVVWLLWRVGRLSERVLHSIGGRADTSWDDLLLPLAGKAIRLGLPLLAIILAAPALATSPAAADILSKATSLALISLVAVVVAEGVGVAATFVLARHRIDVADNLQARSIYTQVVVLKKVTLTVVAIFTLASMLMVFESVRQFGASILASAGIAGIVVGFAAQRSIATLLAGFQMAITQPIRVDDVVIVESEWGRVEDITLTYVVVRIWDQRRLIVPMTHFIEQPFQNWTRSSADLLGAVLLHVDYSAPLDALRQELTRILAVSPYWDGKVNALQVTAAKECTLEIRALASAADASLAWDLRCEVREKLVAFLQTRYPGALPRVRYSVARI